jgi:hypothetical protein
LIWALNQEKPVDNKKLSIKIWLMRNWNY